MRRCKAFSWPVIACLGLAACGSPRGTIGAVLAKASDGRVYVRETPVGLAANKAGLQSGDEILLVDGIGARDLSPQQLHALLAGGVGDAVKLTVARGETVIRATLPRTPAQRHRAPGLPDSQSQAPAPPASGSQSPPSNSTP